MRIFALTLVINGLLLYVANTVIGGTPVAECTRAAVREECNKPTAEELDTAMRLRCVAMNVRDNIYATGGL